MLRLLLFPLFLLGIGTLSAQYIDLTDNEGGSLFGIRGGLTLASQSWSGFEMRPLLTYHGDVFVETIPEEGRFSLWASLGYHIRGSRINSRNSFDFNGNLFRVPGETFEFQNISLGAGGKQVFRYTALGDLYYTLGVRVEYNVDTNLDLYNDLDNLSQGIRAFYPLDSYQVINRFVYGVTVGGGIDIPLSEKVGVILQVTAQPDFSFQYNQPSIPNVIDPFRLGQTTTLQERQIRNFTLEVSAGFRFLRKIEYID